MTSKYLNCCITLLCFFVVIFSIMGTVVYLNNCNSYLTNGCNPTKITCEIKDHYVYNSICSNDDDDVTFSCYKLVIKCIYNNNYCDALDGYYSSYNDAEDYFENHYYHNETISLYLLDNNQTCSFSNPIPHPYEGIFGFYSIVFSMVLFLGIIILTLSCCIKNRQSYTSVNEPLLYEPYLPPKYMDPPKYQ